MTHVIASDAEAIEVATRLGAEFAAASSARDLDRTLPRQQIEQLSDSGLFGITVPADHGGAGVSARTVGRVFAALSAGDSSIGQIPQNHFFFLDLLSHAGTPQQHEFFYAEVLAGRRFGNALTERGGTTAKDYRIEFAQQADGRFRVHGRKYYATGSPFAHWIPIYANDPDGQLHAAWVPADDPGVVIVDDWVGMGQKTTGSGTVTFADVLIPADYVVPAWTIFERPETFGAFGNYMHAAVDVGIAVAALRDGRDLIHSLARPWWEAEVDHTWQEPVIIQQFGELAVTVRAAKALLDAAGDALDAARAKLDESSAAEASAAVSAARAQADTAANTVSSDIFALIGTRAAADELNLHRHWRNARTHTLHDPRRWKVQRLGEWELNGTPAPRNGIA